MSLPAEARVRAFLAAHDMAERLIVFEGSTKTAQLAAEALGCQLGQIAKSLVFLADDRPVVCLVAGDRRGDVAAIGRECGAAEVRFADAESVERATGYTVGGVSPFDLPADVLVLIDESLGRYETVFPAGGTDSSIVRMTFSELAAMTSGRVCAISR